jgi:hypothetical protein
MRSSKLLIKSTAQKVMANSSFGHRFYDLIYFEVGFFPYSLNSYKLEGTFTKIV